MVLASPPAAGVGEVVTQACATDELTPRAPGRIGCSTVARQLGESLAGTAPVGTTRWLLVEHPGPWPIKPAELNPVLARAEAAGVRVQLIRRPAKRRRVSPHQVYVVNTAGPERWIEGRELAYLAELDLLDLAALAAGRRPGFGEPVEGPLYLLCTHGRRDACCAEFGRPVAAAVARAHAATWETTHLGGDRFAANAVCFPDGLYFGRLDPVSGPEMAAAYARGEIVLPHFRGRAGTSDAVQVAEHHVRRYVGALGTGDVTVESTEVEAVESADPGPAAGEPGADTQRTTVVLRAGDRRFRVTVESGQSSVRQQLTCRATEATCAPVRRVAGLTELSAVPAATAT